MRKSLLSIAAAAALFVSANQASAQIKIPQASSTAKIEQSVGIKSISLQYQRPNTNGRVIFGELVPYNEVWRTGANNLPVITFQEQVTIGGKEVPAGTYGLLTIPNKGEWTIILSKNSEQWGAYTYKAADDQVRFQAKATTISNKVESFTMNFEDVQVNGTNLVLAWEHTQVSIPIVVDQKAEILASIDAAMQSEKKPYFQAAQFYLKNNLDLKKAAEWMNEADKGNTKAPHIKYWKAKVQLAAGDKVGAQKTAQEGIAMAKAGNNEEYVKLNTQVLNDAK